VIGHRKLSAPLQHGAVLIDPPLQLVEQWLAGDSSLESLDLSLCGQSLRSLRHQARQAVIKAAHAYLAEAGQELPDVAGNQVLAAGHQPEVFHPGVWVKNFALCGLAKAHGLVPLNLVVDNDTVKSTALALPCWPPGHQHQPQSYRIKKVAFDARSTQLPYEEHQVGDEAMFASFPDRATTCTRSWPFPPLLAEYWSEVQRHCRRTSLLGERLAAGRRALEQRWGCRNLELPVSRLCDTQPFAWFAAHLFGDFERFFTIYNDTVGAYRRAHGLRSRNHPVPDLVADGDWRELPFWAWRAGAKRRGRLFVRRAGRGFELKSDDETWPALPAEPSTFVQTWQELRRRGFKIRSRALTTTLHARLLVAHTFIHGIGGGKYDELTDEIMRRFYGIDPPGYLVLSTTLLLPLETFVATLEQRRQMSWKLRDLHWNPQRHLSPQTAAGQVRELVEQKQTIVAGLATDGPVGWERHLLLRQLNAQLQPFVGDALETTSRQLARTDAELAANAILRRRDYPFCLYPETLLRGYCEQFLQLPWEVATSQVAIRG
jgi:hypothetical protein